MLKNFRIDNLQKKTLIMLFLLFYSYLFISPIWSFIYIYDFFPYYNYNVIFLPLFLLFVLLTLFQLNKKVRINWVVLIGTILIILIVLIQLVSFPYVISYSNSGLDYYFSTIFNTILISSLMWIVGIKYNEIMNLCLQSKKIKLMLIFSYAIYVICILYGIFLNGFNISNLLSIEIGDLEGQYLNLSTTFAIISILLSSFIKRIPYYIVFHLFVTFLLLTLLSRSTLIIYCLTIMVGLLIKIFKENKLLTFFAPFILILGSMFFFVNLDSIQQKIMNSNNRILYTLFNNGLSQDSSLEARNSFLEAGLVNIKENWLYGKFMWYTEGASGGGTYIHNWLSFYSNYGLIPFIIFIILVITLLIRILKVLLYNYSAYNLMVFNLLLFNVISIVLTKSFEYTYIWLALGVAANIVYKKEKKNEESINNNL